MTEETFCCEMMAFHVLHEDRVVEYRAALGEYVLPVHDGGSSGIVMNFCPWCGIKLPTSKRGDTRDDD
jgi:hypothetical protein